MTRGLVYPLGAALLVGAACASMADKVPTRAVSAGAAEDIAVSAAAVPLNAEDPAQRRVGSLVYLGGLHIRSGDARFGGISGLRWSAAHGYLLAVSDAGSWLTIEIDEDGDRLTGVKRVRMGPLLDTAGRPFAGKGDGDAEAIALIGGDGPVHAYVTFENDHRVLEYALDGRGAPSGPSQPVDLSGTGEWRFTLPENGGMETLIGLGGRDFIAFAEDARNAAGNVTGIAWLAQGGLRYGTAELRLAPPFQPTDGDRAESPDAPSYLLARSFSPLQGVAARVLRLDGTAEADGHAVLDGEVLAEFRPPLAVDNFEGLALRAEGGRRFLYIISDDNFSPLQRTLLLKFEVVG